MKSGPLSIAEKFFVEQKYPTTSVDEIATILDRPKGTIEKCINKHKKEVEKAEQVQNDTGRPPEKEDNSAFSHYNRKRGATVMTQTAAEMSDALRKTGPKKPGRKNCIAKIRAD